MDPLNQNQPVNPMNQQANSMVPPAHEKPIGPAIGIIIIIAVIVIGGLYFWGQRASTALPTQQTQATQTETQTQPAVDQTTQELQKQSSADDLNSIEADLKATNLNGLGNEVNSAAAAASTQ
jgi:uncharacterized membrane protein YfbV (UPF0208 family)